MRIRCITQCIIWFFLFAVDARQIPLPHLSENLDGRVYDDDQALPTTQQTHPNQPPQHYIPALTIDPSVATLIKAAYARLVTLISHKPPVGIVLSAVMYRLVVKGRLFRLHDAKDSNQPGRGRARRREKSHRAIVLDENDQLYVTQGGVQSVRRRLLQSITASLLEFHPLAHRSTLDDHAVRPAIVLLEAMVACLKVTHHPGSLKVGYIRDLIEPYSRLRSLSSDASILPSRIGKHEEVLDPIEKQRILDLCLATMDVCLTDALLRLCRDRLLSSSLRLARAKEYWKRRVNGLQGLPKLFPLDKLVEGDRMRLSLASAALQQELTRLGQIGAVLLDTPTDIQQELLIKALRESDSERRNEKQTGKPQHDNQKPWHIPNLGSLSNKASQYYRDNSFHFRKMGSGDIRGKAAIACLSDKWNEQDAWMRTTSGWSIRAKRFLCAVVQDTLTNSVPGDEFNAADFSALEKLYCASPLQPKSMGVELAKFIKYVESMSAWRRVGEGKELRLGDTFIADWSRRLDFLGIPSSLLAVWVATRAHAILQPYWPRFRQEAIDFATKSKEIVFTRLVIPIQEIAADILNKHPGMMAGFGLDEESSSLDRMLRDMGFGDGTEASRHEALMQATDEYEKDLQSSLFGMLVKGRLVTLLLLQMQQLKVGLLSALADIDVLMQGNRINFQLMAAIPAVVLVYFGAHFSMRRLYNIRAKDLRPVTAVHADMTIYLNDMERVILSTTETMGDCNNVNLRQVSSPSLISLLSYSEYGRWMLTMHRYLILLDYSSPPYPQMSCSDIHLSLLSFGGRNGALSTSGSARNLEILRRIQQKHEGLNKFL
ncbi:hypothetical protein MPSEU_000216000 [Mayamaea pseudoterrestris]|nr:hypothetical protein MPSEU_000216000 [Mayamaea pseudoterrestris]